MFKVLMFLFFLLVSCTEKSELEKKYAEVKEAEKITEMKKAVKRHEEGLKDEEIRKKKAERWFYGVQQLSWVDAARDSGLIDKGVRPKKTASEMAKKIYAWMDLKSDEKPYFGDPREVPGLLKEAGYSEDRIRRILEVNSAENNPYLKQD